MRALLAVAILTIGIQLSVGATPIFQGAQTDSGITAKGATGEVKAIDLPNKLLTIKTDAGSTVFVTVSDRTAYKKLAPGEQSLTNATDIALSDVAEGDRIWARGTVAEDRKSVPALMIVLMSKGDISKKQEAERAEWRRRGIVGVITALKPETKEITIAHRSMAGNQAVVIPITDKTEMRRYAPDSIKFSDAKPNTFAELKVGDQLRALGNRGEDPLKFSAEKVVTGSFRTVAGVVKEINAATGEIKIQELEKKQPLTIVIKQDAVLRKVPAEFAAMAGGFNRGAGGGAPGGGGQAPAGGQAQGGARPAAGPGGPGGAGPGAGGPGAGGPGGGRNINDMLERLPMATLADMKVGDTILVSSTQGADPTRLTAISLVAGAEPLLAMLAPRPQAGQAPNPSAGLGSGISFGIGLP